MLQQSEPMSRDEALAKLTCLNVKMQIANVEKLDVVKKYRARVVGWLYQVENGHLKDLSQCTSANCTCTPHSGPSTVDTDSSL